MILGMKTKPISKLKTQLEKSTISANLLGLNFVQHCKYRSICNQKDVPFL